MPEILLDARAMWDPATTPAYALVPRSGRFVYYANPLTFDDSGEPRHQLLGANATQTVESLNWAQNYTLSTGGGGTVVPDGMTRKSVQGSRLLCTSDQCGQQTWHNPQVCSGVFADSGMEGATIYLVMSMPGGEAEEVEYEAAEAQEAYSERGEPEPEASPEPDRWEEERVESAEEES